MIRQGIFRRTDHLAGMYKVPGETVDVSFDWTDELKAGQTIASVSWAVGSGMTGANEGADGAVVTKRISGGTAGTDYRLTCTITKSNGEVVPRTLVVSVVAEMS